MISQISQTEMFCLKQLLLLCDCVVRSCGTFEQTVRGLCKHSSVIPAPCAAFTLRVIGWSVARRTTQSKCGICLRSTAGQALHARWRWLDTRTLYAVYRWIIECCEHSCRYCTDMYNMSTQKRPPKYNGVVIKILGKNQWNFYNWI